VSSRTLRAIRDSDFVFENSQARVIANRNSPEIKLAGVEIGPFEEGKEYEVYYWIAQELQKSGMAHCREDENMGAAGLYKIQWTERVQAPGQISKLPDDFYPRSRRYLAQLKKEIMKSPEKMREYEKVEQSMQDVINSRLKKVIAISSSPTQTEQTLRNLTREERYLYERLHRLVSEWRTQILEYGGTEE